MLGQAWPVQQRDAFVQRSRGQVLGQFDPDGGVGDDAGAGDELLDFAAYVGRVPGRAPLPQPGQDSLDGAVAVECAGADARVEDRAGRVAVAQRVQFGDPMRGDLGPIAGDDLARSGVVPCPVVPLQPQAGAGFLPWVRSPPGGFVAVQVGFDLRGAGAERAHVLAHLRDLTALLEGVTVRCESCAEGRVGHHRRMPDPIDRVQRVTDPDRVQPKPAVLGPHPGVDLKMQMPVRITRPRRVMAHRHRLQLG